MTLSVKSWIGPEGAKRMANVLFDGVEMKMLVSYDRKRSIEEYQDQHVEFDYNDVISIEIINCANDNETKIAPYNGVYEVVGKIHNVIECGPDKYLVDLYIQPGPNFICIEVGSNFAIHINKYARVIINNLCCFPTFT